MKIRHNAATPVVIAMAIIAPASFCVGQDSSDHPSKPHFAGQTPGEVQEILQLVKGSISGVDANGLTLTIKPAEEPRTFKVTIKTKITRHDGSVASLSDAAVGKRAVVTIKTVHGQPDEVVAVRIEAD